MTRHLLLALALAVSARAQVPVPAPAPAAAAESLPPSISTTGDPATFETAVAGRRGELRSRLDAVQATASETRTAQIEGLAPVLSQQLASLEATLSLLGQQVATRREIHATQLSHSRLEEELSKLRANGPEDPPPYPVDRVDGLRAEAEAEAARRPALEAAAATSKKAREEAVARLESARARLTEAEAALARNGDATRTPLLQAQVEAARAELQRAREAYRFRDLDHRGDQLELEAHRLRTTLLDEKLQWFQRDLVFRPEDLDRLNLALDKQIFDLGRILEAARLEGAAAERRWSSLRARVDARPDPSELDHLEVQTRFQELQASQREAVLLEARIQRARMAKELWSTRLQLRQLGDDLEALRALERTVDENLETLSRDLHLQESRLTDLRRERALLEGRVASAPDEASRRLWRAQVAALDRFLEAGRANLASIEATLGVARSAKDELVARRRELTRTTPWRRVTSLAAALWSGYLSPIAWPLGKILLIFFLGIPLNLVVTRRVQQGVAKVYSPQTGMLAGKVVYYTGALILLGFFLSVLGVGLGTLVGAAGITGVALGFASQTSVSNIISGLFLIAEQPFQVGEMVTVGDVTGVVLTIDLISVKLRKFDNELVRIPNETILKSNLTNISRHPIRRIPMDVGVAYKEDLDRVEELLLEIARDNPDVLENPEPMVFFLGFGTSGIDVRLNSWTVQPNFLPVKSALFKEVKRRFDAAGIEIPFPHVSLYAGSASGPIDVRLHGEPGNLSGESAPGEGDAGAGAPASDGSPRSRSEGGSTA